MMNPPHALISLLSWFAKVPPSHICMTTNLRDDLMLDQVDMFVFLIKLERCFRIQINSEELDSMETVRDVNNCISRHLQHLKISA